MLPAPRLAIFEAIFSDGGSDLQLIDKSFSIYLQCRLYVIRAGSGVGLEISSQIVGYWGIYGT